jgi:hypothetical protein
MNVLKRQYPDTECMLHHEPEVVIEDLRGASAGFHCALLATAKGTGYGF